MPKLVQAPAVSTRLPGVKPGDNATYVVTGISWETDNVTAFKINPFATANITRAIVFQVMSVVGANVTFVALQLLNGPPPVGIQPLNSTENVDVQTQSWCDILIIPAGNQTFCYPEGIFPQGLIASGLTAPDAIGADPSLTLNQTVTRTVLGVQRNINLFNETIFTLAPAYCFGSDGLRCSSLTARWSWAWDQATGIQVANSYSEVYNSTWGYAKGAISQVMVSTNAFNSQPPPDFTISTNPTLVIIQGGGPGTSTVMLTSTNGFTGTVTLQASTSSPKIACSLSQTTVLVNRTASVILTCHGSAGTYTVTIEAVKGSMLHSATVTYNVLHGHRHLRLLMLHILRHLISALYQNPWVFRF